MNQLFQYLSTIPQTKELVLLLGENADCQLVYDIGKMTSLERLVLFIPSSDLRKNIGRNLRVLDLNAELHLPDKIEIYDVDKIDEYKPSLYPMAFCFDAITNTSDIIRFHVFKPQYILGIAHRDYVNTFSIWEAFRRDAEKIYILSNKANDEVLNWSKSASKVELSVVFPMYNIAKYLPECIESIQSWDAEYVEYLFVDDGSPDNCADIVRQYAERDHRIKLLQKKNGGCASARQYGLEHAQGKYIGFIDPDDYIDTTMFQKLFERAITGSYEIAYCGYNELYESNGETKEIHDLYGIPYSSGTADSKAINELLSYLRVAIWRGIYSRDLIERNHIHFYTDLRRFDDLPFKVEVLSKARSVVSIPEHLYFYRLARPGQDVAADDERLYVHFPIFNYLDQFIRKSSDQKQLDYLQIVKLHTHKYALEKIRSEFLCDYVRQASADIQSNFKYLEGLYIIRQQGKRMLVWYTALYFRWSIVVKKLIDSNVHTRDNMLKFKNRLKKLLK